MPLHVREEPIGIERSQGIEPDFEMIGSDPLIIVVEECDEFSRGLGEPPIACIRRSSARSSRRLRLGKQETAVQRLPDAIILIEDGAVRAIVNNDHLKIMEGL